MQPWVGSLEYSLGRIAPTCPDRPGRPLGQCLLACVLHDGSALGVSRHVLPIAGAHKHCIVLQDGKSDPPVASSKPANPATLSLHLLFHSCGSPGRQVFDCSYYRFLGGRILPLSYLSDGRTHAEFPSQGRRGKVRGGWLNPSSFRSHGLHPAILILVSC